MILLLLLLTAKNRPPPDGALDEEAEEGSDVKETGSPEVKDTKSPDTGPVADVKDIHIEENENKVTDSTIQSENNCESKVTQVTDEIKESEVKGHGEVNEEQNHDISETDTSIKDLKPDTSHEESGNIS